MGYVSTAAFISFVAFIGLLGSWASDPNADPAERRVLATTAYSLGGATAINSLCAVIAAQFGLVEPVGSESAACAPYGIVSAPIIARMHLFNTGGYGEAEWSYVYGTPARATRMVENAVCKALGKC